MGRFIFDNDNNEFLQEDNSSDSVFGDDFDFLDGNDRLVLLRNDDLAGLGRGIANMGNGRDVVITSFNMSGIFQLDGGDDFFSTNGDFGLGGVVQVSAGEGSDLIIATTTESFYFGNNGNDIFVSDGASNLFDGGAGTDTFSLELAEGETRIDLGINNQDPNADGRAYSRFNLRFDSLINIENIRGSGFRDVIFGDINPNRIDGLEGNDDMDGDAGDDILAGGEGFNNLFGGTGFDTLVIEGIIASRSRVNNSLIVVSGTLNGTIFQHFASGFEQVLDNGRLRSISSFMGEAGSNATKANVGEAIAITELAAGYFNGKTINGNADANLLKGDVGFDDIDGRGGNDTLDGAAGADGLNGGEGNDVLKGGSGRDSLDGGGGSDSADYSDKTEAIQVSLNGATTVIVAVGGLAEDALINIEHLIGGGAADRFIGDRSANSLWGNNGNDTLLGGGGNDTHSGGAGSDNLDGGAGSDTADFSEKTVSVRVMLAGSQSVLASIGGRGEDTLVNIENLIGGKAADRLSGDALANRLEGNRGKDTLTGGDGRDSFRFTAPVGSTHADVITDFVSGTDHLSLSKSVFTGFGIQNSLRPAQWLAGPGATAATTAEQRLIYDSSTGILLFDRDGRGSAAAQQVAQLGEVNHPAVVFSDVLLS